MKSTKSPGPNRGIANTNRNGTVSTTRRRVNARPPAAWLVEPGRAWIQVHEARLTESLRKIAGHKLVVTGVAGEYLRTFEFPRPLAWAKRWIKRHAASANEAFPAPEGRRSNREPEMGTPVGRIV